MTTEVAVASTDNLDPAEVLREVLVDGLRARGAVSSAPVEAAMRALRQHLFVPGVRLERAYVDDVVHPKADENGVAISAASQLTIVAMMLEQLDARPGQRILELGAGTGYNAAFLASLVDDTGRVTAIDVDEDIVAGARTDLATADYSAVQAVLTDGASGYMLGAPYERVIATVGAWDLPEAWLTQFAPGGRLAVPVRLRGSVSRSVVFERHGRSWRSVASQTCGFMPPRGAAGDPWTIVALEPDGSVTLEVHHDEALDVAALAGVLRQPACEEWTGMVFGPNSSVELLWLWMACVMPQALSRMPIQRAAIDRGLVRDGKTNAMATVADRALAYLTLRRRESTEDERIFAVGVVGHAPGADVLTRQVVEQVGDWNCAYRTKQVAFGYQPPSAQALLDGHLFDRQHGRLAVSWI